ncbi:helix-turn-helix domain containing protein [Mycoplasma sp. T230T]|nr:helix-turn-helix domain containing protein [Mycoplasma bradburyae]
MWWKLHIIKLYLKKDSTYREIAENLIFSNSSYVKYLVMHYQKLGPLGLLPSKRGRKVVLKNTKNNNKK